MRSYPSGFTLMELLVTLLIIGVLAVMGRPMYRHFVAKARDAGRIQVAHQLALYLKAGNLETGTYPPNPQPLIACSPDASAGNGFYHPDCLKGIVSEFNNSLTNLAGVTISPTGFNHTYYYYNYAAGPVISVQLEERTAASPCPFTTGSWCDPNIYPNSYCICLENAPP